MSMTAEELAILHRAVNTPTPRAITVWEQELIELRGYKEKVQDLEKKVLKLEKNIENLMRDKLGYSDLEQRVSEFSLR